MTSYQKLKTIFKQAHQLCYIHRIMMWDEAVMMPEGAGATRADAMATLNCMIQKILMNKKNKKLIEAAKNENLSGWDKANLKWMEKKYIRAACIPSKLTEKFTRETLLCEQAWRKMRAQNNWRGFLPYFKRSFKLAKEIAERRAAVLQLSPYDALIDEYAPGFNQKNIDLIFSGLKQSIPQLTQQIIQKQKNENIKTPTGPFAIEKQKQLGFKTMQAMQFDFNHGRLDVSHHPFCSGDPLDVRITTRYSENEFLSSLLGVCHETGHGLYEQGLPREWIDQPVGNVDSMAMHESQSLLIEMQVCRSLEFYQFLQPDIQHTFGSQPSLDATNLYQLATRVGPSLIRVDADEVTYPLHIILRYEIEKKLLNGDITVQDIPTYWDESMTQYLGLSTKKNYKDGAMQDVHWPSGAFGYFPAYTLGRLIAAQLFATFLQTHPNFFQELKSGNFLPLKKWLNENIHAHAASLETNDLLVKVTGKPLDPNCFIEHIRQRYL